MINTKAVAIDGPSGAGKSTIARAIAKELGYIYVDTGALYRAIGLYALTCGADTRDAEQVVPLLKRIEVALRFVKGEQRVILNGEDVSQRIRENAVSMAASNVSAIPEVRAFLFDLQRSIAAANNVIMDGRDIGTVVLPGADVKVFLTATPEDRAKRRCEELALKGELIDYRTVLNEIKERDYNDSHREVAPLKKADDAVTVDTTGYMLEQSVAELTALIKARLGVE